MALIEAVKNIFREENNMVELEAPVSVSQTRRGEERRGDNEIKASLRCLERLLL